MKVISAGIALAAAVAAMAPSLSDEVKELPTVQIVDPPPRVWDSIHVVGDFPSGSKFVISMAQDADNKLASFEIEIDGASVEIPRNCWPSPSVFLNSLSTDGGTSTDGVDELWISVGGDYGPTVDDVGRYTVYLSGGRFVHASISFKAGMFKGTIDACDFKWDDA